MKKLFFVKPDLYLPDNLTIVGSSKIILKKKNGKEIDKSNFIVRFNFASTNGFAEYTGLATSLMVINNNQYQSLESNPIKRKKVSKYLVISPSTLKRFKCESNYFFFEKKKNQYLLALEFLKYFDIFFYLITILIRKNFSIGFCFILLCIKSGINLKIYGFDLDEDMLKREYYFKKQKIGGVHDLVAEHKVLKKLIKYKLINFQ